ncbi:hypothetical protein [Nocardia sp. NPDC059239]|uniref:hypothetical protein n=1 Tax=Nocardia sp. NPDC059239 TaxID=3346785 RepID=UPI0036C25533
MYTRGDYVVLDYPHADDTLRGKVFTVTKVLPVNIDIDPVSDGKACRAPKTWIRPATAAERDTALAAAKATPPLYYGSIVTKRGSDVHYVVIGLPNANSSWYKLVPLGGTPDATYLRADRSRLTLVEPHRITIATA